MAASTDVKQLLLQVDASVELLRRNLNEGQSRVDRFATDTQRRLDTVDRRFGEVGRPLGNLNTSIASTRRQIATISTSVAQTEASVRRSADGMKAALLEAAGSGAKERTRRMRAMRKTVVQHDVARWARDFLSELGALPDHHDKTVRRSHER